MYLSFYMRGRYSAAQALSWGTNRCRLTVSNQGHTDTTAGGTLEHTGDKRAVQFIGMDVYTCL